MQLDLLQCYGFFINAEAGAMSYLIHLWILSWVQVRVNVQPFPNKCIDGLVSLAGLLQCVEAKPLARLRVTVAVFCEASRYNIPAFPLTVWHNLVACGRERDHMYHVLSTSLIWSGFWHPIVGNEFRELKSQGGDPSLSWVQQSHALSAAVV